jgi:hypothetical protein
MVIAPCDLVFGDCPEQPGQQLPAVFSLSPWQVLPRRVLDLPLERQLDWTGWSFAHHRILLGQMMLHDYRISSRRATPEANATPRARSLARTDRRPSSMQPDRASISESDNASRLPRRSSRNRPHPDDTAEEPQPLRRKEDDVDNGLCQTPECEQCVTVLPGTGKTHVAIALGLAACRQGRRVRFFTAAGLVNRLEEAQKQYQLEKFLTQLDKTALLICDELGYLSFSRTGAELLFQVFADRYERASLLITSNLAFSDWGQIFQGERMTAALLDRLTHRCHIFEMNGESYRFRESIKKNTSRATHSKKHTLKTKSKETNKAK